jgi:hypothetical protein
MAGRMSRNKGARGEREVIAEMQAVVDEVCSAAGRESVKLQRNLLQAHSGGCDLHGLDWLSLEVKRQENESGLGSWWKQTLKQTGTWQTPVLVWRRNHQPWRVRMKAKIKAGPNLVVATVDMDFPVFLVYFRERLKSELAMGLSDSKGVE